MDYVTNFGSRHDQLQYQPLQSKGPGVLPSQRILSVSDEARSTVGQLQVLTQRGPVTADPFSGVKEGHRTPNRGLPVQIKVGCKVQPCLQS